MKSVLLAVVLSAAASAASAQECKITILGAGRIERPAVSDSQEKDAYAAMEKLTKEDVIAANVVPITHGNVVLKMSASGMWQLVLSKTGGEGIAIARADTNGINRAKLLPEAAGLFKTAIKESLRKSLSDSQQVLVTADAKCSRKG